MIFYNSRRFHDIVGRNSGMATPSVEIDTRLFRFRFKRQYSRRVLQILNKRDKLHRKLFWFFEVGFYGLWGHWGLQPAAEGQTWRGSFPPGRNDDAECSPQGALELRRRGGAHRRPRARRVQEAPPRLPRLRDQGARSEVARTMILNALWPGILQ